MLGSAQESLFTLTSQSDLLQHPANAKIYSPDSRSIHIDAANGDKDKERECSEASSRLTHSDLIC